MIKYNLLCKNCDISFDSWFASSFEYEKLKKRKLLSCHSCGSKKIEKNLMAPKLIHSFSDKKKETKNLRLKKIDKKIREYQKFIKKNFEYVGSNFAYEARSIHYNEKKRQKGIVGTASNDEIKELRDEGIETDIIPWVEDKSN